MDVKARLQELINEVAALTHTYHAIELEEVVTVEVRNTLIRDIECSFKAVSKMHVLLDTIYPGDWDKNKRARLEYIMAVKEEDARIVERDDSFAEVHTDDGALSKECPSLDEL